VVRSALLAVLALSACQDTAPEADPLSAQAWLTRASLDLRGVRPTLAEVRQVHDDPRAAEDVVLSFLDDARVGQAIADRYAELFLTRAEDWPVGPEAYGLYGSEATAFVRAVGDAPLQMVARVVDEDLAWTELVLGDWTMAESTLAKAWPLAREDGQGWQVARWTDGRPAAGLLASTSMWWRYGSTDSNANRGRAAQVSRLFLCVDYSQVEVPFDPSLDLLDQAAVEQAIRDDPSCASCHDTLDPLAGYLYGFWYIDPNSAADATRYHPERERQWRDRTGLQPALDGREGWTLRDLGRGLAADSRFPDCAVQQAWEMLLRQPPGPDDDVDRIRVRNAFIEGGLRYRTLLRTLVTSQAYRRMGDGPRMASPDLMASQIEASRDGAPPALRFMVYDPISGDRFTERNARFRRRPDMAFGAANGEAEFGRLCPALRREYGVNIT